MELLKKLIFFLFFALLFFTIIHPTSSHAQSDAALPYCFRQDECGSAAYPKSFAVFSKECATASSLYSYNCIANPPAIQLSIPIGGKDRIEGLQNYIVLVYKFLIGAAGVLAGIMITIAGFEWLTARGDSGKIKQAKERITKALIGLALALGSYTILYTINPALISLQLTPIKIIRSVPIPPRAETCDPGFAPLSRTSNGPATQTECNLECGGPDRVKAFKYNEKDGVKTGCCSCKDACSVVVRDRFTDRTREQSQGVDDPLALRSGTQAGGQAYYKEIPRSNQSSCQQICTSSGFANFKTIDPCDQLRSNQPNTEQGRQSIADREIKKTECQSQSSSEVYQPNICCYCTGQEFNAANRYATPGNAVACQTLSSNTATRYECDRLSGADGKCTYITTERQCKWTPTPCSATLPCPNPSSQQCVENKCITTSTTYTTNRTCNAQQLCPAGEECQNGTCVQIVARCAAAGDACGNDNGGIPCCTGTTCITRTFSLDYCRPDIASTKIRRGGLCDQDSDCENVCNDSNDGIRLRDQEYTCGSVTCNSISTCKTACEKKRCK